MAGSNRLASAWLGSADRLTFDCAVGIEGAPAVRSAPREVVLDRYASHTAICPDSMRAYKAFSAARAVFGAAAALGTAVLAAYLGCAAAAGGADSGSLIRHDLLIRILSTPCQHPCALCRLRRCQQPDQDDSLLVALSTPLLYRGLLSVIFPLPPLPMLAMRMAAHLLKSLGTSSLWEQPFASEEPLALGLFWTLPLCHQSLKSTPLCYAVFV